MINKILKKTADYLSLVKFSHTIFAMPFALAGYFLAAVHDGYGVSIKILILVICCMVFARSAAMSFNRVADLRYDRLNPRTATREIPSGKISLSQAKIFVILTSVLFIVTTAFINRLTLILSPVALFVVLGYSYTKRFTSLCHLVLGLGLSLSPIGAYIAVTGRFAVLPLLYSAIVLTWVSGFDIIYSLQDDEFDRARGLFSIPAVMSRKNALIVSAMLHIITVILVAVAGLAGKAGIIYYAGAVIFLLMLAYEHVVVKPGDLGKVNLAFATINSMAGLVFGAFAILDMYL